MSLPEPTWWMVPPSFRTQVYVVLDVSDRAEPDWDRFSELVNFAANMLAQDSAKLFFMGDETAYSLADFPHHAAMWMRQHQGRLALISPCFKSIEEHQKTAPHAKSIILLLTSGTIFDLEDWAEHKLLSRLSRSK